MDKLFRNLEKLEGLIVKLTLCSKEVLEFEESCKYLDIPYDFLLALCRVLPHDPEANLNQVFFKPSTDEH